MGCGCGSEETAMPEDKTQWVEMTYSGTHDGPVQYKGYLNRRYLVKRGDKPQVHPDDVPRLEKVIVKGKQMFARKQVKAAVAAAPEPTKPPTPPAQTSEGKAGQPTATKPMWTDKAFDLAKEANISLATITGTGKDGLITVADVRGAMAAANQHE